MVPTQQRLGAAVAGLAAVALTGLSFLDWFRLPVGASTADAGVGAPSLNLWQAFSMADLAAAAAILVGLALALAALARGAVATTMALSSVAVLIGLIAAVLVACGLKDPAASMTREPAAYAGLLAAIGIAMGGYLGLRDDRPRKPATPSSRDQGMRNGMPPRMLR